MKIKPLFLLPVLFLYLQVNAQQVNSGNTDSVTFEMIMADKFVVTPMQTDPATRNPFVQIYCKNRLPLELHVFNMNGDCERQEIIFLENDLTIMAIQFDQFPPGKYLLHFYTKLGSAIMGHTKI